jgi:glycosyltransferase involved in cell wall biosynthesis
LGAPVVIGPMNGGMSFPPAFRRREGRWVAASVRLLRAASTLLHRVMPGKLKAEVLLVANERTRRALPRGTRGGTLTLVENGVDLSTWGPDPEARPVPAPGASVRFAFVGRLVDWKGVDLLLDAFQAVVGQVPAALEVLGDGPMADALKAQAGRLGLAGSVEFVGWRTPEECARRLRAADVLVLPSLYECGGAVVLEAMACGLPVIATNWGGPADYLDESCGILVAPDTRDGFIQGLTEAMVRLAGSPALRAEMGRAGRARVVREFAWERKIDRVLEIYGEAARLASKNL